MDTNSKNNSPEPKSWQHLVANAKQAEPREPLDVLDGVKRAIAAETFTTSSQQTVTSANWQEDIIGLFNRKWLVLSIGVSAIAILCFGWASFESSSELSLALELSPWLNAL